MSGSFLMQFSIKIKMLGEIGFQDIDQRKGVPPLATNILFQCWEVPGEAASRTCFLNKKQLSGFSVVQSAWKFVLMMLDVYSI